ncbi:EF-hand domain-containing protein [Actinocrispum sp. NPDC049592]|uniref:EF-hand domain-containing protein n=1 Tax=Actinocrispum sp. NPDC049592 TaxID=3154835 RepID=UPI00341CFE72
MASDLQRRKVTVVFAAMDADGDGFLDENDFRALTSRWVSLRGPGDEQRLSEVMMGWWSTLRSAAGAEKITVDGVLGVVEQLPRMPDAVIATADAMFDAVDRNGDDYISPDEYRTMMDAWRGRPTDTDAVFPRLDHDGDGRLSRSEFAELWLEFWAGDDIEAAGTLAFGPLESR